ncbi:MAG: hypothetical protein WC314_19925 [Vulcanimicrobiota bacterium]
MDFVKILQKRVSRFEGATVTGVAESSTPGGASGLADLTSSGRSTARSSVGALTGSKFYQGDRVLMLAGGDNDAPVILGKNPYIF